MGKMVVGFWILALIFNYVIPDATEVPLRDYIIGLPFFILLLVTPAAIFAGVWSYFVPANVDDDAETNPDTLSANKPLD